MSYERFRLYTFVNPYGKEVTLPLTAEEYESLTKREKDEPNTSQTNLDAIRVPNSSD